VGTYKKQERGKKTPRRKRAQEDPPTVEQSVPVEQEKEENKFLEKCERFQMKAKEAASKFASLLHAKGSQLLALRAAKLARRAASRSSPDLLREGEATLRRTEGPLFP